jgi:hypothetical protein
MPRGAVAGAAGEGHFVQVGLPGSRGHMILPNSAKAIRHDGPGVRAPAMTGGSRNGAICSVRACMRGV